MQDKYDIKEFFIVTDDYEYAESLGLRATVLKGGIDHDFKALC